MRKLEKKRCLITGGGKGIGRAIALAFAEEGADVAIIDRDSNAIKATVSDVGALGVCEGSRPTYPTWLQRRMRWTVRSRRSAVSTCS